MKKFLLNTLLFSTSFFAMADEGMWLLPDLKHQNETQLKAAGLQIEVEDLYSPEGTSLKDAVVIFGSGCTAEVISSKGLILTNHHCGYGAIQKLSNVEHNYLQDGFWAMNNGQELPAEGLKVTFIDRIVPVTERVTELIAADPTKKELDYLSPTYLARLVNRLVDSAYRADNPHVSFELKQFYNGNAYYLFHKIVYSDVRLVGTPPSSIGKFGFDTDNWIWPRHTGDFSIFRIYTSPDGRPAKYAAENIPLQPKKWLKISLGGYKEDDYAMICGFPGRTDRYMTSAQIANRHNIDNRLRAQIRGERQRVMLQRMQADPKVNIQYALKHAYSSNYWKNAIGMNEAIDRLKVIDNKLSDETDFLRWAESRGRNEYVKAYHTIQSLTQEIAVLQYQLFAISECLTIGIEFTKINFMIDSAKVVNQTKGAFAKLHNPDYSLSVDRDIAKTLLPLYCQLVAPEDRPTIFAKIEKSYKGDFDRYIETIFRKSLFASPETFDKRVKSIDKKSLSTDPMWEFAQSVAQKRGKLTQEHTSIRDKIQLAQTVYIHGLMARARETATPIYPDANSTQRFTYGSVRSYSPRDGVTYDYITHLNGVIEKEDSTNFEFTVPDKLKMLYAKQDFGRYALPNGKMPIAFITTNDITGGNSGSPVMNGRGELIGTAFDGNWEALSGDLLFEKNIQRCINVDIRYTLFIIEKYGEAGWLINEMDIVE